jgi:alanine-synthesizing transaminase
MASSTVHSAILQALMTSSATHVVTPIKPSSRLNEVRYAIRDLAVLADQVAKTGKKILPLNIGDPLKFDFRTPEHLVEAVHRAMRDNQNGYAPSSGIPEALDAIRVEAERKGIRNILDLFVTSGVSEAVDLCLTALLDAGDNVLCPIPEYPLYSAIVAKLGAPPNGYMLDEANGWEPDLRDIERKIDSHTRAIVFINPNNPTGSIYSRRTLEGIAEIARLHNLVVFADEIYDKLVLEGEHLSLAALAPDVPVITFGGLSKGYLAPGWRIGWAVASGPETVMRPYLEGINKLLRSRLCANAPIQYAIKPALLGSQNHLVEVLDKLRARRNLTQRWCESTARVSCVKPNGAFYAFPRIDVPEPDGEFVKQLVTETGVLVVHGSGFGQAPGTKHFRIVFLPDERVLGAAYESISQFIERRYGK